MSETLQRAADEVAAFAARPVYGLSDVSLCDAAVAAHDLVSRATAVLGLLVREANGRDLPRRQDATSAVAWLRDLLRITPAEARLLTTLGETLDGRPTLADAVVAGTVNAGQAAAIGRVLADVPAAEPALVDKVEAILIEQAHQFEPTILRQLGERVLAHLNPDLADARLRERLEREDKHARQRRGLTLASDGLGGTRIIGILDTEGAAIIGAAIEPLAKPARGDDGPDLRTTAARRADALVEVCRLTLQSGGLPHSGGQPPQLNVTVDFDALRRGVAIGQLDTGASLSPATTRQLACTAQILPVVLNGAGVPIDVGRSRRPYTGAARIAVLLRDGGCAFPGCDRPPRWTDVHHIIAWQHGGTTDRDNGVALCRHHHRLIHTSTWTVQLAPDRRPEFIPPTHIDPTRTPRRNTYHPRT
ncbi:MAG TPA: DUF222 domain-containing protein [Micromonosporaceae bacterium]|nr:DUF222 domain-containing protein [Micromonosporaceae bacterium]